MNDSTAAAPATPRQQWLAVLARSPREAVLAAASRLGQDGFEWLRPPEVGLVMVRGRVANEGDRFNLGEATLTRCAVRHAETATGSVRVGLGYVLGRDPERACAVARLDALLQQPQHHQDLMDSVIRPLQQQSDQGRAQERRRLAASRVRFFNLQPDTSA